MEPTYDTQRRDGFADGWRTSPYWPSDFGDIDGTLRGKDLSARRGSVHLASMATGAPMNPPSHRRRLLLLTLAGSAVSLQTPSVEAHDFRLGPLRIEHPYATPTPPGAVNGAAYLRALRNSGDQPDRLIGASTPVAQAVEIHRSVVDAQNVMRMRAVDGIALPPRAEIRLRHGGDHHLMLIDLKQPLKVGDRFPLTLRFERAGEREVTVWVQQPRVSPGAHEHKH
jgi:copper(I)-binding protein